MRWIVTPLLVGVSPALASEPVRIAPGYIYKLRCEGRLLISAVGNDHLVRLDALPKEVGCGALIKAQGSAGSTNLILETSTGTIARILEVSPQAARPGSRELEILLQPEGGRS